MPRNKQKQKRFSLSRTCRWKASSLAKEVRKKYTNRLMSLFRAVMRWACFERRWRGKEALFFLYALILLVYTTLAYHHNISRKVCVYYTAYNFIALLKYLVIGKLAAILSSRLSVFKHTTTSILRRIAFTSDDSLSDTLEMCFYKMYTCFLKQSWC